MIRLVRATPSYLAKFSASGRFTPERPPESYWGGWFVVPPTGYVWWVAAEWTGLPHMRALRDALEFALRGQLHYQDETDAQGLARLLGVSYRRALALLKDGRVEGAYQEGERWRVPLPPRIRPGKRGPRAGW
ncbi:MAG: hypothetical protein KatS3mg051_1522 [Anaerolineae bacterium]|nr:MAG: hypothetical protein KatS3mg051_1522 [Anaerolineae bacterium]